MKVQIEGDKNFFFITDDVNKDSDSSILNFSVSYSEENVKIESENLKEKKVNFEFDYSDYSEELYFKYYDGIKHELFTE